MAAPLHCTEGISRYVSAVLRAEATVLRTRRAADDAARVLARAREALAAARGMRVTAVPPAPLPDTHYWVALVAHHFGMEPAYLRSRVRTQEVVQARWIAIWLLLTVEGWTADAAAHAVGLSDHSTVLYARACMEQRPDLQAIARTIQAHWIEDAAWMTDAGDEVAARRAAQ